MEEYCICHLATGDLLRAAVAAKTEVGMKAKAKMNAGKLVDDDILVALVKDNLNRPDCAKGFILDGFPRTQHQTDMLDLMLAERGTPLDKVIALHVPDEVLEERICGRWIHKPSGRSYHTKFNPPKIEGKDDMTGESLVQRSDDNAAKLKVRLGEYHAMTKPILDHYGDKVAMIEANKPIDDVWAQIKKALG